MTRGAGAWMQPKVYSMLTAMEPESRRTESAVAGIQNALNGAGFPCEVNGSYDRLTSRAVGDFQRAANGRAGPIDEMFGKKSSRELFTRLTSLFEHGMGLTFPIFAGYCWNEGGGDPGAQGSFTPSDIGIVQINLEVHDVTMRQACNPFWALYRWAVPQFDARLKRFAGNVDAAIIGHRSPLWARGIAGELTWDEIAARSSSLNPKTGKEWTAAEIEAAARDYIGRVKKGWPFL